MGDRFFEVKTCDRCGKLLVNGRIMSMINLDVICLDCKRAEMKRPDYKRAQEAEMRAVLAGDYNFPGIELKN